MSEIKPYVPGKAIDEVKRELGLEEIIKLASNESPFPPFPSAIKAIEEAIPTLNEYPLSDSYYLREAISKKFDFPIDQIVIGAGADELISLTARCLLGPGDEAVMPSPAFIMYPIATRLTGASAVQVPLKNDRVDLKGILEAVNEKTKIVFLDNPNNPAGTIFTQKELQWFLNQISDDVAVLLDQAYQEFVTSPDYPDGLDFIKDGYENVIVTRTFSKIFSLAGLRVGYGFFPVDLAEALNKTRGPFNVGTLGQVAALASLNDEEEVFKRKTLINNERDRILFELKKRGFKCTPTQANFIFFETTFHSEKVFQALLKKGIIVRPGHIFGRGYEKYVRLTIGTKEENDAFINALDSLDEEVVKQ